MRDPLDLAVDPTEDATLLGYRVKDKRQMEWHGEEVAVHEQVVSGQEHAVARVAVIPGDVKVGVPFLASLMDVVDHLVRESEGYGPDD